MKELEAKKRKEEIQGKKHEVIMMHGSYDHSLLVATLVVER